MPSPPSSSRFYEYLDNGNGYFEWRELQFSDESLTQSLLNFPDSVHVRLCLIEGITPRIRELYGSRPLNLPLEFFSSHEADTLRQIDTRSPHDSFRFFAKWARPVEQSARNWEIEKLISTKKPYNLDINADPHRVKLNHERYSRNAGIYRPYWPIKAAATGTVRHAALESVSFHLRSYGDKKLGKRV